jgi:signal transduction histidine kinase/ActR/RegA family two-component response regulator/HPt (histidine-containing phosphotransfer) domain-containing protein
MEGASAMSKIAMEKGYLRFEWMYKTASGEPLPAETTLVRVALRGGYCLAGYIRDLREVKAREKMARQAEEMNREMEIMSKAAQAASESKIAFLASMSHEIRTPMNAIIGMSSLIRTDNLDAEQLAFFNDIKFMSGALLQIINDILDFSKIEMGKLVLTPVHFDLLKLYDNIVSLTRFMAERKGLKYFCSFDADVIRVVHGDDVRLRQIITNLLSNAIKYTSEGSINFGVKRVVSNGKDCTVFIVSDTGIGIRKHDMPRLFEKFAQFDLKKNHNVSGAGLGLHITKQLVEMMNGSINVNSEYGTGTTFTVAVPLVPGQLNESDSHENVCFVSDGSASVLVVDDNEINLRVACAYLAKSNIKADTAANGAEALYKIQQKQYHLVFMDHMMPDMDGVEVTARIRALNGRKYKTMPIIALSANAISGVRDFFIKNGMNDYLSKPIESQSLNRVLAKWLPGMMTGAGAVCEAPGVEKHGAAGVRLNIDRAEGLKNCADDAALYRRMLEDFASVHGCDLYKIEMLVSEGDCNAAMRVAHTLKSTSALIGARSLSRAAMNVEKSLRDHCGAPDTECMESLSVAFEAVIKELEGDVRPSLAVFESELASSRLDRTNALILIERLSPLLKSNNTDALAMVGEILEILSPVGDGCDALIRGIEDFEFGTASEVLDTIRRHIVES